MRQFGARDHSLRIRQFREQTPEKLGVSSTTHVFIYFLLAHTAIPCSFLYFSVNRLTKVTKLNGTVEKKKTALKTDSTPPTLNLNSALTLWPLVDFDLLATSAYFTSQLFFEK